VIPLRDENPTRITPWVNYGLVAANVVVFLYQLQLLTAGGQGAQAYQAFVQIAGVRPAYLMSPAVWGEMAIPAPVTLLTSMFVHGGIWHLLGNMLYLWVFGDNIEDEMGHFRYLGFYLVCGLGAAFAQIIMSPWSEVPMVGASGAIAGILGAYLILHPRAQVLTLVFLFIFIRIMYLPAVILLGLWFLIQLLSATGGGPGVAWYAHIGGFLVGVLLVASFAGDGGAGRGGGGSGGGRSDRQRRRLHVVH